MRLKSVKPDEVKIRSALLSDLASKLQGADASDLGRHLKAVRGEEETPAEDALDADAEADEEAEEAPEEAQDAHDDADEEVAAEDADLDADEAPAPAESTEDSEEEDSDAPTSGGSLADLIRQLATSRK